MHSFLFTKVTHFKPSSACEWLICLGKSSYLCILLNCNSHKYLRNNSTNFMLHGYCYALLQIVFFIFLNFFFTAFSET